MINIDQAGLGEPAGRQLFAEDIVEHQDQEAIALDQEFIDQEFLVDGFQDLACFDHGLLIKILAVKNFYIKSIASQLIIPQCCRERYGSVFESYPDPSCRIQSIDFPLALAIGRDLYAAALGHVKGLE